MSYDGKTVTPYLDINDPKWGVSVNRRAASAASRASRSTRSSAARARRGFGKFYTYTDTTNTTPPPDFTPGGGNHARHGAARVDGEEPGAATYDGGPPRELIRLEQPFANHNGGHIAFNPLAAPGSPNSGCSMGVADGGSGGDPLNLSQNLGSAFGKILRIDPLGTNSANKQYGIPAGNPFVGQDRARSARSTPTASQPAALRLGLAKRRACSSPTSARTSSRRSAR